MEKFAIISDVHSNLEALQAVLKEVEDLPTYSLGDLVDYGANPNEVVDLFREKKIRSVLGNHDYAAVSGDASLMNPKAAISSHWTSAQLAGKNIDFLRELPKELKTSLEGERACLVHGSPDDQLWEYVDPRTHSLLFGHYLAKLSVRLIGLGHTHVPYVWKEDRGVVFNPGSVGQPRDGDWRASYATVTVGLGIPEVQVNRVEYDVRAAAEKIRAAGLPSFFAERLYSGA